jgi:hypothetical protein
MSECQRGRSATAGSPLHPFRPYTPRCLAVPPPHANPFSHSVPAGYMYGNAANLSAAMQVLAGAYNADPDSMARLGLTAAQTRDFLRPLWLSSDLTFQQGMPWEMFTTTSRCVWDAANGYVLAPLCACCTSAVVSTHPTIAVSLHCKLPCLCCASNYLVRGKNGGMPGYTTYTALVPELRWSVAILWNGDSVDLDGAITNATSVLPSLIAALQAVQVRVHVVNASPISATLSTILCLVH